MPRTRSIAWSQLKLGIVGVIALGLVALSIVAVGGQGGFTWQRYPLKAKFANVGGLKTGAVVRLNGKEVGLVKAVEFAGAEIDVTLEIKKDVRSLVTTESTASIGSLSLLGDPIIDLTAASSGTPLPDGAYVKAGLPTGGFGAMTQTLTSGVDEAAKLIAEARAGRGTLGQFIANDALYRDLEAFVDSATRVTKAINSGEGTIGGLVKDPAAYESLKKSLDSLQVATERLQNGTGALARLLNDDAMGKSLAGAVSGFEEVGAKINRGEGTVGKLVTDKELYDRFNSLADRVDKLMAGVNQGQGTVGQLLSDRALYENMNQAVVELRTLLAEIRKDPKKYLRVSVSIF